MSRSDEEGFRPHPGDPWHPGWKGDDGDPDPFVPQPIEPEADEPERVDAPAKRRRRFGRRRDRRDEDAANDAPADPLDEDDGFPEPTGWEAYDDELVAADLESVAGEPSWTDEGSPSVEFESAFTVGGDLGTDDTDEQPAAAAPDAADEPTLLLDEVDLPGLPDLPDLSGLERVPGETAVAPEQPTDDPTGVLDQLLGGPAESRSADDPADAAGEALEAVADELGAIEVDDAPAAPEAGRQESLLSAGLDLSDDDAPAALDDPGFTPEPDEDQTEEDLAPLSADVPDDPDLPAGLDLDETSRFEVDPDEIVPTEDVDAALSAIAAEPVAAADADALDALRALQAGEDDDDDAWQAFAEGEALVPGLAGGDDDLPPPLAPPLAEDDLLLEADEPEPEEAPVKRGLFGRRKGREAEQADQAVEDGGGVVWHDEEPTELLAAEAVEEIRAEPGDGTGWDAPPAEDDLLPVADEPEPEEVPARRGLFGRRKRRDPGDSGQVAEAGETGDTGETGWDEPDDGWGLPAEPNHEHDGWETAVEADEPAGPPAVAADEWDDGIAGDEEADAFFTAADELDRGWFRRRRGVAGEDAATSAESGEEASAPSFDARDDEHGIGPAYGESDAPAPVPPPPAPGPDDEQRLADLPLLDDDDHRIEVTPVAPPEPAAEMEAAGEEYGEWRGEGTAVPRSWFADVDEDEVEVEDLQPVDAELDAPLLEAGGMFDVDDILDPLPDEERGPAAIEPEAGDPRADEPEDLFVPPAGDAVPPPERAPRDPIGSVAASLFPEDDLADEAAVSTPPLPGAGAEPWDAPPLVPPAGDDWDEPTAPGRWAAGEAEPYEAPELLSGPAAHGEGEFEEESEPYREREPYAEPDTSAEFEDGWSTGETEPTPPAVPPEGPATGVYDVVEDDLDRAPVPEPSLDPDTAADWTEGIYSGAVTVEHRGLAEAIARASEEDTELQALSAAMPGLDTGVVGFDDVEDLGTDEVYVPPARSDLGARVLTGLILMSLLLGSLWAGGAVLAGFIGVMLMVGLTEYFTTLRHKGYTPLVLFGYLGAVGALAGTWVWGPVAVPAAILSTTVVVFFFYAFAPRRRDVLANGALTVVGTAWITGTVAFAMPIIASPDYRVLVFALVAATVAMDVGAYAFGRAWGSAQLAPVLSPNKSIEGLAGGVVLSIGLAILIGFLMDPFDIRSGAALGLVVAVAAPIGDLAESMFKRSLGVKDMGSILPGHGGIMDRIDAFLFVIPPVWVLYELLGYLA